jgi:hypothetical protein
MKCAQTSCLLPIQTVLPTLAIGQGNDPVGRAVRIICDLAESEVLALKLDGLRVSGGEHWFEVRVCIDNNAKGSLTVSRE